MNKEQLDPKAFIDYLEKKEIENQKELEFLNMKSDIEFLKHQILELNERFLVFSNAIEDLKNEINNYL